MPLEQFRKQLKQELLTKHAKFFAAGKQESRKYFQGIRYLQNGTAAVSDMHILLRIKDVSPYTEPHTIHAITGEELEGYYPDDSVATLFNWDPLNSITLETDKQVEVVTKYAKIAAMIEKELKSAPKIVNLKVYGGTAYLEVIDQIEFKAPFGVTREDQNETWYLNADYLYNAMNLFKSAHTRFLVIKLRGNNEPVILSDEESGIDVLILPIRS